MSANTDPITKQLEITGDHLHAASRKLIPTTPYHPDRVRDAHTAAVSALDAAEDALSDAKQAGADATGAFAAYRRTLAAHMSGQVKTEPKAPSPAKLEEARVKAVGRASVLVDQAVAAVRRSNDLEASSDAQAELRDSLRAAYRETKPKAAAAFQAFELARQAHAQVVSLAACAWHEAGLMSEFDRAWQFDRRRREDTPQLALVAESLGTDGPVVRNGEWIMLSDSELADADAVSLHNGQVQPERGSGE